jgi:serpin B
MQAPSMNNTNTFKLFQHNDFSMLEMHYGRKNYAMDILLPAPGKTPDDIIKQMNAATFSSWTKGLSEVDNIPIAIPKFKFEYEKTLDDMLSAMGMDIAFTDSADFSGISTALQLLITEVKHKTFIDVNEEGTEAAAATSVGIGYTSMPNAFIANRPFVFVIRERDTQTVLFIGKLCVPAY